MSRNQSDPDLLSDTVPRGRAAAQDDRYCFTVLNKATASCSYIGGAGYGLVV